MTNSKTIRRQKLIRSIQKLRINNTDAPAYALTWTTVDILDLLKRGLLKKPSYQRKPVWDIGKEPKKQKMNPEFITTVLDGQMIDAFMVQETPTGHFQMLNCQQRCNSLKGFFNNKFAIPKKIDPERAGLRHRGLTKEEQSNFRNHEFLVQVQISKNGKGLKAYLDAQKGMSSSKQEVMRGGYYKTGFFKLIQSQLKKPIFKNFFEKSGVLTPNAISRCEDEEFMGDVLLLESSYARNGNGLARDGIFLKQMLDEFSTKPFGNKKFMQFKKTNPEQSLAKHIRTVNKIFPNGLALKEDTTEKLSKKQRNTRLGNKTAFYRLLGAIKMVDAIHGDRDIFTDAKCKKLRILLPAFATKAGADGRAGKASGNYQRYYASTTRATTSKTIREIGIEIIKDLIITA